MEDLITQRFQYVDITLFKNYCRIDEKPSQKFDTYPSLQKMNREVVLSPKKKKNSKYFYSGTEEFDGTFLQIVTPLKDSNTPFFQTTKDRHIKKQYGNPFAEICIHTLERSVRRHGDKITVKIYKQVKKRNIFCKFFNKTTTIHSLTFDMVKGNFTILDIGNGRDLKQKRFRKNSFFELGQFIVNRNGIFNNKRTYLSDTSPIFDEYITAFNDEQFRFVTNEVFGFDHNFLRSYILKPKLMLDEFIKLFVKLKKIKVPNEYSELLTHLYPTEKFLKKNDRKLISSVLDMFGIKTKLTIKILHTIPDIDVLSLAKLCYLFGDNFQKYLGTIDEKCFSKAQYDSGDYSAMLIRFKEEYKSFKNHEFNISENEKENMVKIINGKPNSNGRRTAVMTINNEFSILLWDHFNMIKSISKYDPNIRMLATNHSDFNEEHSELTKIIQAINKGWVVEYQFNPEMKKDIETPLTISIDISDNNNPNIVKETFYPIILKREEEYIEEGNFMHHCVATYSDKDKSVIISIRTKDGSDRITCEFDAQTGFCIQSRHFCNGQIPADMELALEQLKKKTKFYANLGMLYCTQKERVPVKINGIDIDLSIRLNQPQIYIHNDLEF